MAGFPVVIFSNWAASCELSPGAEKRDDVFCSIMVTLLNLPAMERRTTASSTFFPSTKPDDTTLDPTFERMIFPSASS
ncbi:hypothetical protein [Commensalibacter melissae]|uniref:hypothetical protein n=1 Tax=Commensalibacter melissae TaxID=2070537 RepID=UPI0013CEFE4D|nr:hypothetical protein [Commensalibacter melissae]